MTYHLSTGFSPTMELLVSLKAYLDTQSQKLLEIGPDWRRQVAKSLPPHFDASVVEKTGLPLGLVRICPDGDQPQAFIDWLRDLPIGTLYELVLSVMTDPAKLPPDLGSVRERYAEALQIWYDHYFSAMDPAVHQLLSNNAQTAASLVRALPPDEALERITNGLVLDPDQDLEHVVLVPQYHHRPFNLLDWAGRQLIIAFPAAVPAGPGAVPADLRHLTRALADENRLLILRFLAGGERTFSDVVKFAGLAKSTVHHHLVILRVSGLIRVHMKRSGADRYSLRPAAIDSLGLRLHAFLKEE